MFNKLICGLFILVLVVCTGIYIFLRTKLPQREGELKLSGLMDDVKVVFDKWAIPHISAENELDAYRVLGYLHAQDRLFQLELMTRVAQGRLSEILGESTLDLDRYFRTLGIHRYAKKYTKENYKKKST